MNNNIAQEYGRVTAMSINRLDKEDKTMHTVWFPQFEIIKYRATDGETISEIFVCINDENTISGVVECNTKIEAIQYAIDFRDNIN